MLAQQAGGPFTPQGQGGGVRLAAETFGVGPSRQQMLEKPRCDVF